jgi:hypothetical protein
MGYSFTVKQVLKPGKAPKLLVDDLDSSELLSLLDQPTHRYAAFTQTAQLRQLDFEARDELTYTLETLTVLEGSQERLRCSVERALSRTLMMCADEGGCK